ncbi:hypothetical protein N7523_002577 [Penicillium sp. IBT 18751x]|nr:hypothetical protein N7523_002577 [Penicillium sp. IBT 18751x]
MRLTLALKIEPMCKAFLCFYSAISNEFLGRAAHLYSRNKLPLLHQALDSFLDSGAALAQLIPMPKLHLLQENRDCAAYLTPLDTPDHCPRYKSEDFIVWDDSPESITPEQPALIRSMTQMIDLSLSYPDDDPFISDSQSDRTSPFALTLPKNRASFRRAVDKEKISLSPSWTPGRSISPMKRLQLAPSPLRIQKSGQMMNGGVLYENESNGQVNASPRSKRLPLQETSATRMNIMNDKGTVINVAAMFPSHDFSPQCKFSTPSSIYSRGSNGKEEIALKLAQAHAAKIVRFNHGVEFLREQISTNIAEIQQLVSQVKEVQRTHRACQMQRATSFWSFHPITNGVVEEVIEQEEHVQKHKNHEAELFMDEFGSILHKETQQQRLTRLRSDGWSTVGLRSTSSTWKGARYYQEFCNMVLTELSLDN